MQEVREIIVDAEVAQVRYDVIVSLMALDRRVVEIRSGALGTSKAHLVQEKHRAVAFILAQCHC